MNYFVDCSTVDEAKARYRELVKKHHPDSGGDATTFIEIQRQYEAFAVNSDAMQEAIRKAQESAQQQREQQSYKFNQTNQQQSYYGHMHNGPIDNTRGRYTRPDMQFHADITQLKLQIQLLENANRVMSDRLNKAELELSQSNDCFNRQYALALEYRESSRKYKEESKHYKELWDAEYKARCERDQQLEHMINQIEYLQDQLKNSLYKPWYIKLKELVYDKK